MRAQRRRAAAPPSAVLWDASAARGCAVPRGRHAAVQVARPARSSTRWAGCRSEAARPPSSTATQPTARRRRRRRRHTGPRLVRGPRPGGLDAASTPNVLHGRRARCAASGATLACFRDASSSTRARSNASVPPQRVPGGTEASNRPEFPLLVRPSWPPSIRRTGQVAFVHD
jgi:hypothetical protein